MFETSLGYEILFEKAGKTCSYDYLPSEQEKAMLGNKKISSRNFDPNIKLDNGYYTIPVIGFKDKLTEKTLNYFNNGFNFKPQCFYINGKCWVILSDSVRWIEQTLRWKPKLLFYK